MSAGGVYGKRGLPVRLLYLAVSMLRYAITLGGRIGRRQCVFLCYHGIGAQYSDLFRRQMECIAPQAKSDEVSNTARVFLTFDDAFENLLENVMPTLETLRIPAVIFAVSENLGQTPQWKMPVNHPESTERTMTEEQLIKLSQNPLICIGSHTQTHPDLSQLPTERVNAELNESKRDLERLLSQPVEDLALPHGAYNATVLQIARQAGYKRIYTLAPRSMPMAAVQEGIVSRFLMTPDVWPIEFYLTCAGAYAWLDSWRSLIRAIRRQRKS